MDEKEWEVIHQKDNGKSFTVLQRIEVPGGYLYRNVIEYNGYANVAITFVPVSHCTSCGYDLLKFCGACNTVTPREKVSP